jgi:hypothetical protein
MGILKEKIIKKQPLISEAEVQEECFRRGYLHGFYNARHPDNKNLSVDQIVKWRHNINIKNMFEFPPGSFQRTTKKEETDIDPAFAQFSPY